MPSRDRQRVLARAKLERQMARRAASARRRRQIQAAAGAAVALAVVIGGTFALVKAFGPQDAKDEAKPAASAVPSASAEPSASASAKPLAPGECSYAKAEKAAKDVGTPPAKNVPHAGVQKATIKTNNGVLEVELDLAKAPCTANSFAHLAAKKYFDGTSCHRLTTSGIFVLQCGDPTAKGTGGPGYQFGEENLPTAGENNYPKGVLAMANAGKGTNGSQFFIVYKDTKLPPDYTIFGKVTKGLEGVEKVAAAGVDGGGGDGAPKLATKLESVTVSAAPKS